MLSEEQIVPYSATDLTGRRAMVLAPHPDDETLGCGGSLMLHKKAGDPVKVVFLTNGVRGDFSGKDDPAEYVALRRREAQSACARFGVADCEFWPFEDRRLAEANGALERLTLLIRSWRPELVYAPSPFEFHPDHRATAFLLFDAIESCDLDFEIALYEVNQPLKVNCLVDITEVAEDKYSTIAVYSSQLRERDFTELSRGLDRFRSLTLPEPAMYAEAFFRVHSSEILEKGFMQVCEKEIRQLFTEGYNYRNGDPAMSAKPKARQIDFAGPMVSVIIPTYNRKYDLEDAVNSVLSQEFDDYEVIVVNDGGEDVSELLASLDAKGRIRSLAHEHRRDVAAARNTGLKAARGFYIAYLDDDDIYYPDHLKTLVRALEHTDYEFAYTDANRVVMSRITDRYVPTDKRVAYSHDFDRDKLLISNYIPTLNIMHRRDLIEEIGWFDESLEVHEDWDMWIRAAIGRQFLHIPKTTAEFRIRTGLMPSKSEKKLRFADTIKQIHERYAHLIDSPKVAEAQEQARKALALEARDSEKQMLVNEYRRQHFYRFVSQFARGGSVLDFNCGDGAGSHLLSFSAEFVLGTGPDSLLTDRAGARYVKENLRFTQKLPQSADPGQTSFFQVIACFDAEEVLGNRGAETLDRILSMLETSGVLVLSVWDGFQKNSYACPDHGVSVNELRSLLENRFSNVCFWQQELYPVSRIRPCFGQSGQITEYEIDPDSRAISGLRPGSGEPGSFIVAASNGPLPVEPGPSFLVDTTACLFHLWEISIDRIESAKNEKKIQAEALAAEVRDLKQHAKNIESLLADQQKHAENLELKLELEVAEKQSHAANLEKKLADQQLQAESLEKDLRTAIASLESRIAEKDLAASNMAAELSVIRHSLAWRITEGFRRRVNRLFPESSGRRKFYLKTVSAVKIYLDRGFLALFRHALRKRRAGRNELNMFAEADDPISKSKQYLEPGDPDETEKPCPVRTGIVARQPITDDAKKRIIGEKINFIRQELLDEIRRNL